ncbi:MAG: response regulator, partial [Chloroflexota bacterium]|nr:response regulator [Chloroflexota bacterium]
DIKQAQLDLVVSDIVMPNMSGIDLYKLVQERWPGTKMFFITGHPLEDNTQKLLSKGKIVWLQKPFSVRKFRRAICDVFEDV